MTLEATQNNDQSLKSSKLAKYLLVINTSLYLQVSEKPAFYGTTGRILQKTSLKSCFFKKWHVGKEDEKMIMNLHKPAI